MLFDLQSGKRRRVVQVVFGGLAVIFAVSFVFFGVGSDAGFNPFADGGGGGGGDPFEDDIETQEDALAANPKATAALVELVSLHYQSGTRQLDVDPETGQTSLNADAEEELQRGADAWDRYLKLTGGENVDTSTALLAVQTFATLGQGLIGSASTSTGQAALDQADDAVAAFADAGQAQLLVAKELDSGQLVRAAEFFYLGNDIEAGDEAGRRALAAAKDAKQREQTQKALDTAKQQGEQLNKQIDAYRKQLEKATAGVPGAEESPLGEFGGGGGALGGGSGSLGTP
jgi:hypothetical protein